MPEQTKPIEVTATILIDSRPATVFAYYSNYLNDPAWRAEIKKVETDTEHIRTKTRITEESFLSRSVPKHINRLECIELQLNKLITSQTTSDNQFWSRNTRTVEPAANNGTKVTYQLEFDAAIVKYGLGFGLPRFIVSAYTKATMKKYLSSLKRILEQ